MKLLKTALTPNGSSYRMLYWAISRFWVSGLKSMCRAMLKKLHRGKLSWIVVKLELLPCSVCLRAPVKFQFICMSVHTWSHDTTAIISAVHPWAQEIVRAWIWRNCLQAFPGHHVDTMGGGTETYKIIHCLIFSTLVWSTSEKNNYNDNPQKNSLFKEKNIA